MTLLLVSPRNDAGGTSGEIPFWWHVMRIVLLIRWSKFLANQQLYPTTHLMWRHVRVVVSYIRSRNFNILYFPFSRFSKCWQKQVKKLFTIVSDFGLWSCVTFCKIGVTLRFSWMEGNRKYSSLDSVAYPGEGPVPPPLFFRSNWSFEDRSLPPHPPPPLISRSGSGTDTRTFSISNYCRDGTVVICHLLSIWFTFKWLLNIFFIIFVVRSIINSLKRCKACTVGATPGVTK